MNYEPKWERVVDSTWRMKTPSGWLVYEHRTLCYVPDPGHDWKFLSQQKEDSHDGFNCVFFVEGEKCKGHPHHTPLPCSQCRAPNPHKRGEDEKA